MTANVADNALLLEVIAGPDGLDSRQHQVPRVDKYTEALKQGVQGLRIGVLLGPPIKPSRRLRSR